jgi:hypothetical protein
LNSEDFLVTALRGAAFDVVRAAGADLVAGFAVDFALALATAARRGLPFDAARRAFPGADVRGSRAILSFPIERSCSSRFGRAYIEANQGGDKTRKTSLN